MERVQLLIDKLAQQKLQGDNAAQLLLTVQLLQNELMVLQKGAKVLGTSKVAVVMPRTSVVAVTESYDHKEPEHKEEVKSEVKIFEEPLPAPVIENAAPQVAEQPKPVDYKLQKPVIKEVAPEPEIANTSSRPNIFGLHFDAAPEAPTLVQQRTQKELHELLGDQKESLNDRLKQNKVELVSVLKESPVKDLRKAIGVNDKFVFVNELFRGDEAMYERSIKTINGFRILQEAEYWINRELKVKLGWNDSKEIVQHFYQIVRRRFS